MSEYCYCINFTKPKPKVQIMFKDGFLGALEAIGSEKLNDLESHVFRIFNDSESADNFLDKFESVQSSLKKNELTAKKGLKKILLKRRYLVLTLFGIKKHTTREDFKDIKKGELYQFYDQTFFVTVKHKETKEIEINGKKCFEYHYDLVDKKWKL